MSRKKPSVYLDTNIFSMLHYGGNLDVGIKQMGATREWWNTERKYFDLFTSRFTEKELARGKYIGQKNAVALVRRISYLPKTVAI